MWVISQWKHVSCVCDATFGHVQTEEVHASLQREGERQRHSVQETPARSSRRWRDRERPAGSDRLAALGSAVVSLLL